ncbi:hypothetical protein [Kitasatospora terrestris]|uniref:DNA-directed RNA polymerase specialized sigma24 family protein n=1 Tax=Kitasatospora terrestris TaxID=258051 RepID=A0ABP9EG85_9ACTN
MEPHLPEEPFRPTEAALVHDYRRLVALAYLTLPAERGRHSRVLTAHAAVRRSLPSRRALPLGRRRPADGTELRGRVLRTALAGRRPLLPRALGLRLFPPAADGQETAFDQALRTLDGPGRAAWALRALWGCPTGETVEVLRAAGVTRAEAAAATAAAVPGPPPGGWGGPGLPAAFDACRVQVRRTDPPTGRRVLGAALAAVLLAATAALAPRLAGADGPARADGGSADGRPAGPVTGPPGGLAALDTVPPDAWRHTARIDFSAWPARGDRRTDRALLGRALDAWRAAGPAASAAEPGTPAGPPGGDARVLYAGDVDGAAVVLLYDATRIARWTDGEGLRLARADSSDVTTAAAVTLRRTGGTVRYLLAPWIAEAQSRPLDRPDEPAHGLAAPDGVTAPLPAGGAPGCPGGTLLHLRSSPQIAEQHAFALADVGGLLPAHLTYTPPPEQAPARAPREAVGAEALRAWAAAGCAVPDASPGVRALNLWAFAVQQLPADAGRATWMCLRADRWAGDGSAATAVLLPAEGRARRTGGAPGRACSRFEQDTVGWTWWRSAVGEDYLLAAGSRRVTRIDVRGPGWQADGRTLAVRRTGPAVPVQVEARLETGFRIGPLAPLR